MPPDSAPADSRSPITVITATWLETCLTKLVLRHFARVIHVGVGATRRLEQSSAPIIVCGLAGALAPTLRPGTLVIPSSVGSAAGEHVACDPTLTAKLRSAARIAGHETVDGPVLAAPRLVTGEDRNRWAREGFVAVEMESGELLRRGHRLAIVRVVLDTPERELSAHWQQPWSALKHPRVWPEAMRLAVDAPRATLRAARVVKLALADDW